jgi:SAM-dependent methyltransferase
VGNASVPFSDLHCPYCGSSFEWISRSAASSGYGILKCGCSRYPVVDGVPVIQHKEGLETVVRLIDVGDDRRALLATLSAFRITWARRNRWYRLRYRSNCARLVSNQALSFQDAVSLVRRPQVFSDYLLHRWANPSFLAAVGPLMLLGGSTDTKRVLDLACGAGHSSFLMHWLFPRLSVVSVDHDFVSLYLAKRYLVQGGTFLCLDAEAPSPFPDSCFDAVFCLDAFHYFSSKCAVRDQLTRIVRSDGLWVLAHLHNALQTNITAGIPLNPDHYLDMFSFLDCRLFDENAILREISSNDQMDLRTRRSDMELQNAGALTLIGGSPGPWDIHAGFAARLSGSRTSLAVNPIYVRRGGQDSDQMALNWPNEVMRRECAGAETLLPLTCRLSNSRIRELLQGDHSSELEDLVRRFVLVPLPDLYLRDSTKIGE